MKATRLLARSFLSLHAVNPGFPTERLLGTAIELPARHYADFPTRLGFYRELQRRLEGLPGIETVGFANEVPFDGDYWLGATYGAAAFMEAGASDVWVLDSACAQPSC